MQLTPKKKTQTHQENNNNNNKPNTTLMAVSASFLYFNSVSSGLEV